MPRLINCCDAPGDAPVLDNHAYWVRLPDGTRARDPQGKLLAYKLRENAVAEAERRDYALIEAGREPGCRAVPPEVHELKAAQ